MAILLNYLTGMPIIPWPNPNCPMGPLISSKGRPLWLCCGGGDPGGGRGPSLPLPPHCLHKLATCHPSALPNQTILDCFLDSRILHIRLVLTHLSWETLYGFWWLCFELFYRNWITKQPWCTRGTWYNCWPLSISCVTGFPSVLLQLTKAGAVDVLGLRGWARQASVLVPTLRPIHTEPQLEHITFLQITKKRCERCRLDS